MREILIVKTSALGDIIHALPVLDYLHTVVPGIEVDWVVEERFREILDENPLIGRVFTVNTKKWRKKLFSPATWREIGAVREELQARSYKIVFDIQGNLKSGVITWLTGCERRYGFEDLIASGVVITGGTTILEGMPELAEQVFNLPVRRGLPQKIGGLVDVVNSPVYATGVGLVVYGSKNVGVHEFPTTQSDDNVFRRVSRRMREWFGEFF